MGKKYVVRIMATIFEEKDTEIENPKPVVMDIPVEAVDFVDAQKRIVCAIGKIANDPDYYMFNKEISDGKARMRALAGLPLKKKKRSLVNPPPPALIPGIPVKSSGYAEKAKEQDRVRKLLRKMLEGI